MDRGVHFQRVKMDRGGPFYTGGGPFSTVENGPGGSIFKLTPALLCIRKIDFIVPRKYVI